MQTLSRRSRHESLPLARLYCGRPVPGICCVRQSPSDCWRRLLESVDCPKSIPILRPPKSNQNRNRLNCVNINPYNTCHPTSSRWNPIATFAGSPAAAPDQSGSPGTLDCDSITYSLRSPSSFRAHPARIRIPGPAPCAGIVVLPRREPSWRLNAQRGTAYGGGSLWGSPVEP
jgi:hypothetical protein